MAIEQWQIESRRAAGWSDTEIAAWIASSQTDTSQTVGITLPDGTVFQSSMSQYWLDPQYRGAEPTLEQKGWYSGAGYARDVVSQLASQYAQAQEALVSPAVHYYPVAAAAAGQGAGLDTSGLTGLIQAAIDWLTKNILVVVVVIAAVILLPAFLRAATGSGSRG